MAMMGLSKSSFFMPVARHKARAPAMLRPLVEVCDLYLGISLLVFLKATALAHTALKMVSICSFTGNVNSAISTIFVLSELRS